MAKPMFTPEELEELRRADEEIDENFVMTAEDYQRSQKLDSECGKKKYRYPEKAHDYYLKNRERILAKNREYGHRVQENGKTYFQNYRDKNRETLREQSKARYRADPSKHSKRNREYYYRHREEILAKARERHQKQKKEKQDERV